MAKCVQLIKTLSGSLMPASEVDAEDLGDYKPGTYINAEITQPRNPEFHKKFFALLKFAFIYWEPITEYKGMPVHKDFERFREEITIMAGFRKVVACMRTGKVTYKAESISFAKMDEARFQQVYAAVFDVLWFQVMQHIRGMTRDEVERIVLEMIHFDN
jgi:hypothetical protein